MPSLKCLFVLTLLGCQSGKLNVKAPEPAPRTLGRQDATDGSAPARKQPGVTSDCAQYSTTMQGSFQYQNNMWAEGQAKGPFEQCVVSRAIAGQTQLGWTWNWPGYEPLGFGYPEIIFGWKPWSSGSTTALLPLPVSNLHALTVRYAVTTEHTGKVALSISMFVTDSGQASAPNPRAIVDEVVLWLDYPDDAVPVGTRAAEFEIAATRYELWRTLQHGDRGDGTGWDLYYLKGPNHQLEGTIQLQPLLEWLSKHDLVGRDRFVASVELGNELMSGSGTTWVQHFDVVVDPPG